MPKRSRNNTATQLPTRKSKRSATVNNGKRSLKLEGAQLEQKLERERRKQVIAKTKKDVINLSKIFNKMTIKNLNNLTSRLQKCSMQSSKIHNIPPFG